MARNAARHKTTGTVLSITDSGHRQKGTAPFTTLVVDPDLLTASQTLPMNSQEHSNCAHAFHRVDTLADATRQDHRWSICKSIFGSDSYCIWRLDDLTNNWTAEDREETAAAFEVCSTMYRHWPHDPITEEKRVFAVAFRDSTCSPAHVRPHPPVHNDVPGGDLVSASVTRLFAPV